MTQSVLEQVCEIIAEQALLDVADVSPDARPEDLGLDSLGLVETIFAIEERFDISVPFNANEPDKSDFDISSIRAIAEAVERLIRDQKGDS